jgi:hypothetical protein
LLIASKSILLLIDLKLNSSEIYRLCDYLVMVVLFALLLSIANPSTIVSAKKIVKEVLDTDQTSLKRFESDNYGFSLSYPQDWQVIKRYTAESTEMSSVAFGPALSGMNDNIREMVVVVAMHDVYPNYSLDDYIEESVSGLQSLLGSALIVADLRYENISDAKGHSFLFSISSYSPYIHIDSYQTFISRGNQMYLVTYTGGAGYQHYFSDARDVMKSLQFKDVINGISA